MSAIVRVRDSNGNVSSIKAIKGDKGDPTDLTTIQQKASIDDADLILVADSTSNKDGKLVLWSTLKAALSNLYLGKTGDASNVTNAFTTAATKTDLATGEKLSVSLGKIQKWFSSLGTAAFTASTAYDASGTANTAVSTHNSATDAHSSLFSARQKKAKKTVVTLSPGSWNNKSIMASVDGATASNIIIVAPDPSYQSVYLTSNIRATAQGTNSVTFSCDTTPTDNVLVNVVVMEDT